MHVQVACYERMAIGAIPEDAVSFIYRNIDSIADLEALLIVREQSGAPWTLATIAARLYISDQYAQEVMERLRARNLVVMQGDGYRYSALPEEEKVIAAIAELYRRHLIAITNLIHSKSTNRIRQFAEAFKFKKDS